MQLCRWRLVGYLGLMFSVWHFLRKESKQRNESIGSTSSSLTSLTSSLAPPPPSPPSPLEPPPSLLLTTYSSDYITLLPSPSANCLRNLRLITNQKKAHHQTAHTKTNQQLAKQKALEESKDWRLPFNSKPQRFGHTLPRSSVQLPNRKILIPRHHTKIQSTQSQIHQHQH